MKTIRILAILIVLLAITNIAISNSFAGKGEDVIALTKEISNIERQNTKLKLEFAKKTSLHNLSKTIDTQFTSPTKVAGVKTTQPVAMR